MANCGQGEQEMPEALGSATFIWSTGPEAHQETQTRQLGRLQVGSTGLSCYRRELGNQRGQGLVSPRSHCRGQIQI